MTPEQKAAVHAAVQVAVAYESRKAVSNGIMQAVKMIRAAAFARPDMTMHQLADAIENTVKKAQDEPSPFL